MCISELIGSLRQQGVFDIGDVEYAILEENGKLSVLEKADAKPPSAKTLGLAPQEKGISHSLIIDKIIIDRNLASAGWTRDRLFAELSRINRKPADILFFSVDDTGETTIIYKDKK